MTTVLYLSIAGFQTLKGRANVGFYFQVGTGHRRFSPIPAFSVVLRLAMRLSPVARAQSLTTPTKMGGRIRSP